MVRFVTTMTHNPATLLELSARNVKIHGIPVNIGDIPKTLFDYLDCAHRCVNPNCKGKTSSDFFLLYIKFKRGCVITLFNQITHDKAVTLNF